MYNGAIDIVLLPAMALGMQTVYNRQRLLSDPFPKVRTKSLSVIRATVN